MKVALSVACVVGATASMLSAAIVTYPGMEASFSSPGSVAVAQTVGPVILDAAAGQFTDPDTGTPSASATRYYGGILTFAPNSNAQWGSGVELIFTRSNENNDLRFGKPEGRTVWYMLGNASGFDSGINGVGEMPFVVKIVDNAWNISRADIFLGASAQASAEGTPSGFVTMNDANSAGFVRDVRVSFLAESWAGGPSSASLQGFFSGTEWSPAVVPEPTSLGLLTLAGAMALRRRKGHL